MTRTTPRIPTSSEGGFMARSRHRQRGVATIFISMIFLLLITVLVTAAYKMSTVNLRAVGNVQSRDGGIAAAGKLIEEKIASDFWLQTNTIFRDMDIDNDPTTIEYVVELKAPRCMRATPAAGTVYSSVTLPGMSSTSAWNTVWELDATARDTATGTEVRVVQGVRLTFSTAFKDTYCTT